MTFTEKRLEKVFRFIPMFLVMGVIFFASHIPGDSLDISGPEGIDKILHAIAYAVLAVSCIYGALPYRHLYPEPHIGLIVIIFCIVYGISDEFHQSFIPDRNVSLGDLIADTLGAVAAVTAWRLRKKPKSN